MLVRELIDILKTYPQETPVEVNDNYGGQIHFIDCVDFFSQAELKYEDDYPVVMIQVNCD